MGIDWGLWRDPARCLERSARVLKQHRPGLFEQCKGQLLLPLGPELLLWGYGLEDYLKCLYLKRNKKLPPKALAPKPGRDTIL